MRSTDFGPVPISRLKAESGAIFDALRQGRRVLISKRGQVVSVINPPSSEHMLEVADYALPGSRKLGELTASQINNSSSAAVTAAVQGETLYVTKDDRVYGFLEAIDEADLEPDPLTIDQIEAIDAEVLSYLELHPESSAEELRALRESLVADVSYEDDHRNPILSLDRVTVAAVGNPVDPSVLLAFKHAQRVLHDYIERDSDEVENKQAQVPMEME